MVPAVRRYYQLTTRIGSEKQTTPEFLSSMTNPSERWVKPGYEHRVPRTADEFAASWKTSLQNKELSNELAAYTKKHGARNRFEEFQISRRAQQSRWQRRASPYMRSYVEQIMLTLWRSWRRLKADPGFTIASIVFNVIMALILGTLFFDLEDDTSTFHYRAGALYFSLVFNAFASQLEVKYTNMTSAYPLRAKHIGIGPNGVLRASNSPKAQVLRLLPPVRPSHRWLRGGAAAENS